MNPMTAPQEPPTYAEYTGTGPSPLLEVEDGLTSNQRKGSFGSYRGGVLGGLGCFAEKLGLHLSALWVLWFITFVIACTAMSKANQNEKDISNIHTGGGGGGDLESEYVDYWYSRCQDIGTALYGDDVYTYNGHHYQVIGGDWAQMTWRDAEYDSWGRCFNGQPGYLATIGSADENDYLRQKLISHHGFQTSDSAWIGGTDMFNEGTFLWIDGYASATIFYGPGASMWNNFAPGEPNENGSEDCVSFNREGYWNDDNCYKALAFFFVEFDA